MTFGDYLKARREELGITLDQVVDRMGEAGVDVRYQSVWKWEAGVSRPKKDRLGALASALRVSEDALRSIWAGVDPDTEVHTDTLEDVLRAQGQPQELIDMVRRLVDTWPRNTD